MRIQGYQVPEARWDAGGSAAACSAAAVDTSLKDLSLGADFRGADLLTMSASAGSAAQRAPGCYKRTLSYRSEGPGETHSV